MELFSFSDIEAECQDDFMKIRVGFNGSFAGLVYSAGKTPNSTIYQGKKINKCTSILSLLIEKNDL